MRALIVGAGAVGCYLAARLRLGGHDVTLVGRQPSIDALRANGVTLRVGNDEWPVSVSAATDPADPKLREPFELAIVAVKSFATAGAIETLRAINGAAGSTVLCVQNGLGNEESLTDAFGADRIAAAALTTAVERVDPSTVIAAPRGGMSFAPVGAVPHNWLIAAFENTGMPVRAAGDWRALKWSKLCINLIANGVCAALDWTPAQVYGDPTAFGVERRMLVEAVATMGRLGIAPIGLVDFSVPALVGAIRMLPPAMLRAVLGRRVGSARGGKLPSLLVDLRDHRTVTEVDALNGAVAERARRAGISATVNETIARIVAGIASGALHWDRYRAKPQVLAAEMAA